MRRFITSSVLLVLSLASLDAQRAGVPPQEPLALTNASVVNVRTGAVARSATVLIRGGRIESVAHRSAAPAGVRAIDLRGRYVVPGLIDAHVHIGGSRRCARRSRAA